MLIFVFSFDIPRLNEEGPTHSKTARRGVYTSTEILNLNYAK